MDPSILVSVDDRNRLKVAGLSPAELHDLISELLSYFNKKYGEDREVVLLGRENNFN